VSSTLDTFTGVAKVKRCGPLVDFLIRLVREKPLGTVGAIIVLILLLCGIFAPFISTHDVNKTVLRERLQEPSAEHFLGTDNLGRDVFSRIIYGAQISVIIGLAASAINVVLATTIGIISGFIGGKTDIIIQRFVDAWYAFPSLLLLITIMSIAGKGVPQIILVLGITFGIRGSRVTRSAVIAIKENIYFSAAEAIGSSTMRTLIRHVLPNIMAPIIIIFTTSIGGVILGEASLSFLGFGLPPGVPSWGGMLCWEGRMYMELAPQLALWPGLCLSIVVYGVNMFGDAMRDLLDPRLRGGIGRYETPKGKKVR